MEQVHFTIDGMHCDACVRRVKKALANVPGVEVQNVHVGSADVSGEAGALAQAQAAIESAGFTPHR